MKRRIAFSVAAGIFLLLAAVITVLLPYARADSSMPAGARLTLTGNEDGTLLLRWPQSGAADGYLVEILREAGGEKELLHTEAVCGTEELLLPPLPEGEELIFRVSTLADYRLLGKEKTRTGEGTEVRIRADMPAITNLSWKTEPEKQAVAVEFEMEPGDICRVYRLARDGSRKLLHTTDQSGLTLIFGPENPLPEWGGFCRFEFEAYREKPGVTLSGAVSAGFSLERQELLGEELNAAFEQTGHRMFRLSWDETRGDWYEIRQILEDGSAVTLCSIPRDGERSYFSETLENGRTYEFQVVAVGGVDPRNSYVAAASRIFTMTTEPSAVYATVWPVRDLAAYADSGKTAEAGTVKAGKAYCVTVEEDGMFGVRIGDEIRYIDSRFCLINLPDYLGGLCSYEITNSTDSLFKIREFEIPGVTGQVIPGYGDVKQEDGTCLVPLLYPTAQMLRAAAENALARGYRLKIYDAFRPQRATRQVYNRTEEILEQEIPGNGERLTYSQAMTNGIYSLNHFLAEGMSRHNLGLALDLTMVDVKTGEELRMQSAMHDLSWYSVTARNNTNAELLESVMKGAGFAGLSSEWWHFQDDRTPKSVSLSALWDGIGAEGWNCDDRGWRYRDEKGSFYRSCTLSLDGKEYTFDENGYESVFPAGVG